MTSMGGRQSRDGSASGNLLTDPRRGLQQGQPQFLTSPAGSERPGMMHDTSPSEGWQQHPSPVRDGQLDSSTKWAAPVDSGEVAGERMPLGYWLAAHAWGKTRGTARVDLMRPRRAPAFLALLSIAGPFFTPRLSSKTGTQRAVQVPTPRSREQPPPCRARQRQSCEVWLLRGEVPV